ncbi:citrate lyase holo-[acyl-carrier protein] synthase [Levilactobacillus bambusae]|uniref:citrate lyase holo-[acyl-carrier protein] synthase n=1 Tax=Levilactobacillus bambusae TaxID=2024736 RepID=A0A2V1N1E5_9LACO|nr:citrate lyase holo-[acyl-carrier protein] synthase [Levilactobacillus bambusae]PWG01111.1 citrate lyase holo-[acyl-carrier protein] synthase [Levilactobacillus bambusae]
MKSIFIRGKPQEITQVLTNKDARAAYQGSLMTCYPSNVIIAVKLNVPGPIKNNVELSRLFDQGLGDLLSDLARLNPVKIAIWDRPTGKEAFIRLTKGTLREAKTLGVHFEDRASLGRLFDVDIMSNGQTLSRRDLHLPVRQCFLCQKPAKECARSRTHSIADLQAAISALYWSTIQGGGKV